MAGAQRLHPRLDRARAGRLRGARRHPRSVRAGHGPAGAARFLRRHAGDDPQLRSRDAAHRVRHARARSRAGLGIPAHHRDDPQVPHRLCRNVRRRRARRHAVRGGERRPPPSRHGALAAAVPRQDGHAVRLSARHAGDAGAAGRRGGRRAAHADRGLLRCSQGDRRRRQRPDLQAAAAGPALPDREGMEGAARRHRRWRG